MLSRLLPLRTHSACGLRLSSLFSSVSGTISPSLFSFSRSFSSTPLSVTGEAFAPSLDLSQVHIGQTIDVPYEQTIGDGQRSLWLSSFPTLDRLYTSHPFAQSLNFQSQVLPYSLVLFNTISMAHVDESREVLDVGFENAVYIRPAYAGDTLKQTFVIKHLRNTSDSKATLVTVGCELHNQRNQVVFTVDKIMLYPMVTNPYKISVAAETKEEQPKSHLLSHILYNADGLPRNAPLAILRPKQLLLHAVARPIGKSANMALSTLFRWAHPTIFNMRRYKDDELLVTGGLVLAATLGSSSRGMFECLHETIEFASFLNKASPVDLIGSFTYVHGIRSIKDGFEEVHCTTFGVKNLDVTRELANVKLPTSLFTERMKPTALEQFLKKEAPILSEKLVCQVERKIIRQSPYSQQRSIPLL